MILILFDIDGTLVDSNDFDTSLYAQAVHETLSIEIDPNWSTYNHVTDAGILDQVLAENGLTESDIIQSKVKNRFTELIDSYITDREGQLNEIPGARTLLEILNQRQNVIVAFATGGWFETAVLKLQAIGVKPKMFPIASASDSPIRMEIMQIAEQKALNGFQVDRKYYFGDGSWDKQASEDLSYQFIAVGGRVNHENKIPDYQNPKYIFDLLGI